MDSTTRDSSGLSGPAAESSDRHTDSESAGSREDSRSNRIALAVIFAIPTILFADVLFLGSQLYFGDLTAFYYPIKSILRSIVLSGEFPSWNPFWSGGQPFAANPEFHIFYPPHWLILLPDFQTGFRLHILFHIYLAIAGAWFFFRDMRIRIPAAAFGALTFGLGGFYLSYLKMPSFHFTVVWIPIILLFGRRFVLRPSPSSFAACALAWGMQLLAGEPTTILQTGLLLGAFALHDAWHTPDRRLKRASRGLGLVALLSIAAFLVGAVQMLPASDHVNDTVRARGLPWDMVSTWSMPWVRPAEFIYPDLLGEHFLHWHRNVYPGKSTAYIDSFHLGTLAGLLILGGLIHRRRPAGLVVIIAAISFIIAAGSNTPLLKLLYDSGIFRSIRYPEKFALAAALAFTLLAVRFADRCLRGDAAAIRSLLLAAAGVSLFSLALAGLSFTPLYPDMFRWLWGSPPEELVARIVVSTRIDWLIAAGFAAGVAGLAVWLKKEGASRAWVMVMLLVVAVDLGVVSNELVGRIEQSFFEPPPLANALPPDRAGFRIFHAADVEGRNLTAPWTLSPEAKSWTARNGMYPRLPGAWNFRTVLEGDYDMTNLLPTTDFFDAMYGVRRKTESDAFSETLMRMSNAGYVLSYDEGAAKRILQTPPENLRVDEVTPISGRRVSDSPRYYLADSAIQIRDLDDFVHRVAVQDLSGDRRRIAYVTFNPPRTSSGTVTLIEETSSSAALRVVAEGPAYLVISITPHEYWKAAIDGTPAQLRVTNVGYQGLEVPAGTHEIRLRYRNPLIKTGAVISLIAVAALLAVLLLAPRRSGRRPAVPASGAAAAET